MTQHDPHLVEMARAAAIDLQRTARPTAAWAITQLADEFERFQTALNRMVLAHENTSSDTEGKYPTLDAGCIECTAGTVPDRHNTGLCAYHTAKRLLGHE
jgi:hypothetical protein